MLNPEAEWVVQLVRAPSLPYTLGSPDRNGGIESAELTIHRIICPYSSMSADPVAKRVRELTTIQLTTDTRDRLYRLKFRKTYDEFLQELCDRYEASGPNGRK